MVCTVGFVTVQSVIGGIEWSRCPRQWYRHWLSFSSGGGSRHFSLPRLWLTSSVPSTSSSKANTRLLLPAFLILKFCLALHKGLNVLATASIFTVLLVKNLVAKTNSCICLPLESTTFLPSLLEREFFPTIRKIIHQSTPTISQHKRK